jgi:hypothetical protein
VEDGGDPYLVGRNCAVAALLLSIAVSQIGLLLVLSSKLNVHSMCDQKLLEN